VVDHARRGIGSLLNNPCNQLNQNRGLSRPLLNPPISILLLYSITLATHTGTDRTTTSRIAETQAFFHRDRVDQADRDADVVAWHKPFQYLLAIQLRQSRRLYGSRTADGNLEEWWCDDHLHLCAST